MPVGTCGQESPQEDINFRTCDTCGENKELKKFRPSSYKLANGSKKRIRRKTCRKCESNARKKAGLCNQCYKPAKKGHTCCESCLQTISKSAKNRAREDRKSALNYYGNSCNFCGEDIEIFLTIDHIDNNGAEHRKMINCSGRAGSTTYAWLRRNNYPKGFQTLCYNCNCAKNHHSEETIKEELDKAKRLLKN